jgi:hypothetical protein
MDQQRGDEVPADSCGDFFHGITRGQGSGTRAFPPRGDDHKAILAGRAGPERRRSIVLEMTRKSWRNTDGFMGMLKLNVKHTHTVWGMRMISFSSHTHAIRPVHFRESRVSSPAEGLPPNGPGVLSIAAKQPLMASGGCQSPGNRPYPRGQYRIRSAPRRHRPIDIDRSPCMIGSIPCNGDLFDGTV